MSATAIQLSWTAPHTVGSDPVTSYELFYNDSTRRQNVHVTISPPVDSFLLEDLSPDSIYQIRVSATTLHGEGPTTAAISVRTDEAGEFVVTDFVYFLLHIKLHIVWLGSVVVRMLDLQSTSHGFKSWPPHCRVATLGKSLARAQCL